MEDTQFETDLRVQLGDDRPIPTLPDCFPSGYAPWDIIMFGPVVDTVRTFSPEPTPVTQYVSAPSPVTDEKRHYIDLDPPPRPTDYDDEQGAHSEDRLASMNVAPQVYNYTTSGTISIFMASFTSV